jgi:hypothetical protein
VRWIIDDYVELTIAKRHTGVICHNRRAVAQVNIDAGHLSLAPSPKSAAIDSRVEDSLRGHLGVEAQQLLD